MSRPNNEFWKGKRVLLTGHSGFKGSWLAIWLKSLGAEVVGISLPPLTTPDLFTLAGVSSLCDSHMCDIRDGEAIAKHIKRARPEIVFHLAAQPLVRNSYAEPVNTFETNIMGTVHVLEALRGLVDLKVVVVVTTDKVYRNKEWIWPYRESDKLGGSDPYSASKAASELVVSSYRDAFLSADGVALATARAGNVIGGGDWSPDRLLPDAIRAWQAGETLKLRNPAAIRPWQHVLEPLCGYLSMAETLWDRTDLAGAYNFGPDSSESARVEEVIELARAGYGEGSVQHILDPSAPHETSRLALETAKSHQLLGVRPKWDLEESVQRTVAWYRALGDGADARELCEAEIGDYEEKF